VAPFKSVLMSHSMVKGITQWYPVAWKQCLHNSSMWWVNSKIF